MERVGKLGRREPFADAGRVVGQPHGLQPPLFGPNLQWQPQPNQPPGTREQNRWPAAPLQLRTAAAQDEQSRLAADVLGQFAASQGDYSRRFGASH
jgi:hypothetical protein